MDAILGEIIIGIILIGFGWLINKSVGSVNKKLDTVLENQQEHKVGMAEIKKDVESNKAWGTDSKRKIEDHEIRIVELEKGQATLKAKAV